MSAVLVVEDNRDLQNLYKAAIRNEGFEPVLANDGLEALNLLKSSSVVPNLIILDLMMPVMDGWQFMEEFNRDPSINKIPVVVCSASKSNPPPNVKVMRKPVDLERLLEVLNSYCGSAKI